MRLDEIASGGIQDGMGLRYIAGKSWEEITREERVFCQQLYMLIKSKGLSFFIGYLSQHLGIALNPLANWEIAYEVCFYRDLWHFRGRHGSLFSPKRTFDICFLSDDAIVVIEAKANEEFISDQVATFARDKEQLRHETGVKQVFLIGLCSSKCNVPLSVQKNFDGPMLSWREMATVFELDPLLLRADELYEPDCRRQYGKNNVSGKRRGADIVRAFEQGERFFVGRGGGLQGVNFLEDIRTGRWRTQKYETNSEASSSQNRNWFSVDDFVASVKQMTN